MLEQLSSCSSMQLLNHLPFLSTSVTYGTLLVTLLISQILCNLWDTMPYHWSPSHFLECIWLTGRYISPLIGRQFLSNPYLERQIIAATFQMHIIWLHIQLTCNQKILVGRFNYVLGCVTEYQINLSPILNALFNRSICCQLLALSNRLQHLSIICTL